MAKKNLEEIAYVSIVKLILENHFKPGDFLLETTLSKVLSLSRTPVRHALGQLVAEGFLDKKKKKCSSAKEIYEFFSKIIITPSSEETTKCRRTLNSTCQGDPKPLYLKNQKLYCETKLYSSKKQRKHDFYVKENNLPHIYNLEVLLEEFKKENGIKKKNMK